MQYGAAVGTGSGVAMTFGLTTGNTILMAAGALAAIGMMATVAYNGRRRKEHQRP